MLAATSILLLALLAYNLRNLDPGSEELPPALGNEPNPGTHLTGDAGDALRLFFVIGLVVLVGIVVGGSILLYLSGVKVWKLFSRWELLAYAVGTMFLVLLLLQFESVTDALRVSFERLEDLVNPPGAGSETGNEAGRPGENAPSTVLLWLAIAIVAFQVALFAFRFVRHTRKPLPQKPPTARRREIADVVRAAIRDLTAGEDFRAVVLRCYRTMVALFAEHGIEALPSQTAREFELSALRDIDVSKESVEDLTALFEEARYSDHRIGERQRAGAIECLESIRAQLEASP